MNSICNVEYTTDYAYKASYELSLPYDGHFILPLPSTEKLPNRMDG